MKVIVTHSSPDLDAITAVWLIKKYLPGWENAEVRFVPAGERLKGLTDLKSPVEKGNDQEIIHVDTGLGFFDHHQTNSTDVSAAKLVWDYVVEKNKDISTHNQTFKHTKWEHRKEAIDRIVQFVIDTDHFKEVYWQEPLADYHEASILGIIDGLKIRRPNADKEYVDFTIECLENILHNFENRIWAEEEIREKGIEFETRFGKALGIETINDTAVKLGQKMGYELVARKDPRKGYVRIKVKPENKIKLSLVYEKFKKIDPEATWFLHVSNKMLLNGSPKNPKMKPTKLSLNGIIDVLKSV